MRVINVNLSESDQRTRQAMRLGNLLKLYFRVCSDRGCNVNESAREFGASTRTVFRYLKSLELAGVPIYFDHGRGVHRVRPGWRIGNIAEA